MAQDKPKTMCFVVYPGIEILDLCGPLDVFSWANRWLNSPGKVDTALYQLDVIATQSGPIRSACGLSIIADKAFDEVDEIDTLFVIGASSVDVVNHVLSDREILQGILLLAQRARRVVSICTGAFLLAEIGLLNQRCATTHWLACQKLADKYPQIRVQQDRIFIKDGHVYTSGGITAGIDLALSILEEDLGSKITSTVARTLLVFVRRPGGQSQFSTYLMAEAKNRKDFRELQAWVVANPHVDLSVEVLASRVSMSARHFARVFTSETNMTPMNFVNLARIDVARSYLEQTNLQINMIAEKCGFGNPEHMRRTFQRYLKVCPEEYRERFQSRVA